MSKHLLACSFLIVTLAAAGCGGSGGCVWVTGKLVKAGAAYTPPKGQLVSVTLVALKAVDSSGKPIDGEPFLADLDQETGTFAVPGREGAGVPKGKYRVAVTQRMEREAFEAKRAQGKKAVRGFDRETDMLGDRFGIETSPIVREIEASAEIVIDLDQAAKQAPTVATSGTPPATAESVYASRR